MRKGLSVSIVKTEVVLPVTGRSRANFDPLVPRCMPDGLGEKNARNCCHRRPPLLGLATSSSKTIYQPVPALCVQDQFLGDKAIGLPSLLNSERSDRWVAIGMGQNTQDAGGGRRRSSPYTTVESVSVRPIPSAAKTRYRRRRNGEAERHLWQESL
ncbi:hypothetical protein BQ8482_110646 [Mesorhizobium delmotii]|uniref:Uncharacterized protein n=1 Tax=Mesorhizobium delmotii TaxID=1631247 RepID=A0A2P9AC71_9HYPH|nr:hypothetical protein BQ8482_110646 [Mesorhizobium delmotii]